MPDQPPVRLVDSRRSSFVSFAPPDPALLGPRGRTPARAPIEVGSERATIAEPSRDGADVGAGVTYPIQAGKIQPPNLRDETLARTRLLDWLDVKIHRRLVYVIADAGYGKTTLLADFSRRTRLRTIWYRLDEEDRDWVGFLAHLVAAGREHDPGFAPRTASILRSLEPGGPTREDAVETFIEELPAIARDGAALILDDFHLADEVADIRMIAREIVTRGPERLSIVFASRRPPSIPVSKFRSLGELAELGIADLRFSDSEMEQLFRETFGRPLEPDVLAELARRTEGWAASLTLVQAALRERTPAETRSFVRGLSGARDELHDYLAEEVVGDLPAVQQQFLMRTSLLQRVTPELAQVATGLDAIEVQSMITEAERLGLLGRRAKRRSAEQRYHPLVREFLEDRLRREIGPAGVDELHLTVARWAEPNDWHAATHHYAQARDEPSVVRVIDTHLDTIIGTGAIGTAFDYHAAVGASISSAGIEVIRSRRASRDGDVERVLEHAAAAAALDPSNEMVSLNLISSHVLSGDLVAAEAFAESLVTTASTAKGRRLAEAAILLFQISVDGDLAEAAANFAELAEMSRRDGLVHYEGVSELNAANGLIAAGRFEEALTHAQSAIDALMPTSSGAELRSAIYAKAVAIALLGDLGQARVMFAEAGQETRLSARSEYLAEHADIEALVGSAQAAREMLSRLGAGERYSLSELARLTEALINIREGDPQAALAALAALDLTKPSAYAGMKSRLLTTRAIAAAALGDPRAAGEAEQAVLAAGRQRAGLWEAVASLVAGALSGHLDGAIRALPERLSCALSMAAEVILPHLETLGEEVRGRIAAEAKRRPDRWLPAIRIRARAAPDSDAIQAARLLAEVGTAEDIPLVTMVGKSRTASVQDRLLGRDLARRLAEPVFVGDLGRVSMLVGSRVVSGQDVRRKVLALLCFLLTRPRFAATREEVMEAMWPDMAPSAAINSLNQSVYFLRRVFEPAYTDESSAGYVRQDSDLLWLDTTLVSSASSRCVALLAEYERTGDSAVAIKLSEAYTERFALDFSYDEWASDYRDWLHVSCLRVLEEQVRALANEGKFDVGIAVARRALQTDQRNEGLEASLLRLLRGFGAHAAAAEQYERYATLLRRDLGIEPPPMADV